MWILPITTYYYNSLVAWVAADSMPKPKPKAVAKVQQKICDLCYDPLEDSQDILLCEGGCKCNVHRYCAGVTRAHYSTLTTGAAPFVCQFCALHDNSGALRTGTRQEVIHLHCILHCLYTLCESLVKMKTLGHVAPPTLNRTASSKTTPTYILLQNGCSSWPTYYTPSNKENSPRNVM